MVIHEYPRLCCIYPHMDAQHHCSRFFRTHSVISWCTVNKRIPDRTFKKKNILQISHLAFLPQNTLRNLSEIELSVNTTCPHPTQPPPPPQRTTCRRWQVANWNYEQAFLMLLHNYRIVTLLVLTLRKGTWSNNLNESQCHCFFLLPLNFGNWQSWKIQHVMHSCSN